MFVFYFSVASAITPPVAIAAFAAASITRNEPMRTGFAAVRIGIVMFTIPFVFAWYPELLLIEEAVTITNYQGQLALIDWYSGSVDWPSLSALWLRIAVALYLMASALAKFDKVAMNILEVALRLLAAVLILWKSAMIMWIGLALALMLILGH